MERSTILSDLVSLRRSARELSQDLSRLPWDANQPLITLERAHITDVLDRFMAGSIDAAELELWANLVECRDDIDYASASAVIHRLANPALEGGISRSHVAQILADLR